jgi:hypothetical protein
MGNAQQKIAGYLARGYQGNVHCNLIGVDEDFGTADAIRSISDRITVRRYLRIGNVLNHLLTVQTPPFRLILLSFHATFIVK